MYMYYFCSPTPNYMAQNGTSARSGSHSPGRTARLTSTSGRIRRRSSVAAHRLHSPSTSPATGSPRSTPPQCAPRQRRRSSTTAGRASTGSSPRRS